MVLLFNNFESLDGFDPLDMKWNLEHFETNLPSAYVLAAKEAVNNKKERLLRDAMLSTVIFDEV